jgi:WD40 repeat protein
MERGPAVPAYILRGHEAPVHALHFYAGNSFLASGDSDGWMILWSLSSKRPVAVWKAHGSGILQIQHWAEDRLVR